MTLDCGALIHILEETVFITEKNEKGLHNFQIV